MADRITTKNLEPAIADLATTTKLTYSLDSIMGWYTLYVVRESGIKSRLIATKGKKDMYNAVFAMKAMYYELQNQNLIVK